MSRPCKTRIVGSIKIFRAEGGEYRINVIDGPKLGWISKGFGTKFKFSPVYHQPITNFDNEKDILLAVASVEANPNV